MNLNLGVIDYAAHSRREKLRRYSRVLITFLMESDKVLF